MIALGIILFLVGYCFLKLFPVARHYWDWRDLLSTLPMFSGALLILCGILILCWRYLP